MLSGLQRRVCSKSCYQEFHHVQGTVFLFKLSSSVNLTQSVPHPFYLSILPFPLFCILSHLYLSNHLLITTLRPYLFPHPTIPFIRIPIESTIFSFSYRSPSTPPCPSSFTYPLPVIFHPLAFLSCFLHIPTYPSTLLIPFLIYFFTYPACHRHLPTTSASHPPSVSSFPPSPSLRT